MMMCRPILRMEVARRRKFQSLGYIARKPGSLARDGVHGLVEGARRRGSQTWQSERGLNLQDVREQLMTSSSEGA